MLASSGLTCYNLLLLVGLCILVLVSSTENPIPLNSFKVILGTIVERVLLDLLLTFQIRLFSFNPCGSEI